MLKKKKKVSYSRKRYPASFLLILIPLLAFIGWKIYSWNVTLSIPSAAEISDNPVDYTFYGPQPTEKISPYVSDRGNSITFEAPLGWKTDIKKTSGGEIDGVTYEITSPDYVSLKKAQDYYNAWTGILISLRGLPNQKNPEERIEEIMNPQYEAKTTFSDMRRLKIDGFDAASYHHDFEGHSLNYVIVEGRNVWEIRIGSAGDEDKYKEEIESFINSIHFRN